MNKAQIAEAIGPVLADIGCELWALDYRPNREGGQIQIFIDKLEPGAPLDLDDCMRAGNLIRPILDVEFNMRGQYHLEISSPGVDRRLYTTEQMKRYIGSEVKVKLYAMKDSRKNFTGSLMTVDEAEISLEVEGENIRLNRDEVAKINVVG